MTFMVAPQAEGFSARPFESFGAAMDEADRLSDECRCIVLVTYGDAEWTVCPTDPDRPGRHQAKVPLRS